MTLWEDFDVQVTYQQITANHDEAADHQGMLLLVHQMTLGIWISDKPSALFIKKYRPLYSLHNHLQVKYFHR